MIGRLISLSAGQVVDVVLRDTMTIGAAADSDICLVGPGVVARQARVTRREDDWQLEVLGGEVLLNGTAVRQPAILAPFDILTVGTALNLVFRIEAGQAVPVADRTPPLTVVPPPGPTPEALPAARTVVMSAATLRHAMGGPPPVAASEVPPAAHTVYASALPIVPNALMPSVPPAAVAPRPAPPPGGKVRLTGPSGEWTLTDGVHVVGRSPECHVRLDARQISREHAYLTVSPTELFLETANDRNGTSVNGVPIKGRVRVALGDRLGFAGIEFEIRVE